MTQSKNIPKNIPRNGRSLNEPEKIRGNNAAHDLTKDASYIPLVFSQKFTEERKQSIVRYAQSMGSQDRLDCFKGIREVIKAASTVSDKVFEQEVFEQEVFEQEVQRLWQDLPQQEHQSAFFLKQLAQLGFLSSSNSPVNPAGYYFVNEKLKTAYCSIPKNACTLFKNMLVDNSHLKVDFEASDRNIHDFLNQQIPSNSASHLLSCLSASEYFKFVILRNPFHRIVSAYLDKIAKHVVPEAFVEEVILDVQTSLGLDRDIEKSITFSQFIDYLLRTPDELLNDHWRPQYNFVAAVKFDFVGQFESLETVIETLEGKLDVRIRRQVSSHITKYKHFNSDLSFHQMYPHELRQLKGGMPVAKNFFTRDLAHKFQLRYEQDIALYDRHFQTNASNLELN